MTTERRKQPPLIGKPDAEVMELLPGDTALGYAGDRMKTLLGSCVAVILTDPRRTVGTMCHIVHVGRPGPANQHNTAYGEVAMQTMFDRLIAVGIPPARCQAYVFGGGNMFPHLFSTTHVGAKNAQWALDYLHDCGIVVVGDAVGGATYRKVAWTVGREHPVVEEVPSQMR